MEIGEGYHGEIPFRPLQLTLEEQERCQELTLQLLDRTLRSYDERDTITHGSPRHHSNLDSARWKRHKTQENASLYSEREHIGIRDLHIPEDTWEKPAVLLAVGTIQANLDDVMLGLTTQTFGDMRVRAASIVSHDVSGATLAKLSGPTEQDTFQNLRVMWMVGEQVWPLSMFVRRRDFVIVAASGVITRANGDRIGYDLVQPAQLPQLPELPKPMTRGKLICVIITTDAHPMKELISSKDMGVLVKSQRESGPDILLGGAFHGAHGLKSVDGLVAKFSAQDLCESVEYVLKETSVTQREAMAKEARRQYHQDTKFFAQRMIQLRLYAREQRNSWIPPENDIAVGDPERIVFLRTDLDS